MRLRILLLVLVAACASAPPIWTPAARTSPASCSAPGGPVSPEWQLVTGDGFTFCVPPDWRTTDGRTWHGTGGSSVTWGAGAMPRREVVSGVVTMRVPAGGAPPSRAAVEAAAQAQLGQQCTTDRHAESVGGQPARLVDFSCQGQHNTSIQWTGAALYFEGETGDAREASLQLQVYRTVRFLTGADH